MALSNRERKRIIDQIGESRRKILYTTSMSEEEKESERMKMQSLQQRLDYDTNRNVNIFEQDYGITEKSKGNEDIFTPEETEITDEAKKWMFSGYDSGVPKPEKTYPTYNYFDQFRNAGKKR